MSKQASKTLIGAFVVGALTLVVVGILLFGSGQFFSDSKRYVLFFNGSVKGLNVGAPVSFRGVKVGQVSAIEAHFHPRDFTVIIAVYIETTPGWITLIEGQKQLTWIPHSFEREKILQALVAKKGLRAKLQLQSLVTGLLEIEFDFYPDTPVKLLGTETNVPELPTIPSDMEKLQLMFTRAISKLEKMPIDELMNNLVKAVNGIERLTNLPQIPEILTSLNQTIQTVQELIKNLDSRVGPLTSSMDESFKAARAALEQAQKTLAMAEGLVGDESGLRHQLSEALEQISDAARSLRVTAEYLDQHPEALIRGKK